ncbi:MAG: hypothetical protein ABSB30_06360 [Terracidiphilus sp.]
MSNIVQSFSNTQGTMYSRTQNENGTYNTRCLYCFMTIASSVETDKELANVEARHICPERALAALLEQGKTIESRNHPG